MILGINCTTVAPLSRGELEWFQNTRTVESVRFNVPATEAEIVAFLDAYVGMRIRPLLLFDTVEKHPLAPIAIQAAIDRLGLAGFDVESVNEWRNQDGRPTLERTITAAQILYHVARAAGHTGAVLAPSIMNLDKDRDIPDFRAFAEALPDDCTLNVHRYAPKSRLRPPRLSDPWPPARSRAEEFDLLRSIAGAHPIAFTEFGENEHVKYFFDLLTATNTPEKVKADLIEELRLLEAQGVVAAYPYTWPQGDGFGMAGTMAEEALNEWRT